MKLVITKNGVKEIWPSNEDDAKIMLNMLTTGSTVTWSLSQDLSKTQTHPGGGVFFRSEEKPKSDGDFQPKIIPNDEELECLIEGIETHLNVAKEKKNKRSKKSGK